ncbi:MAG: hypothetical protein BGN88_03620 [Clostridiales bacterium 43-6]|nr:MAG: hypothetical protein BGN88_03620 [Clostridiales bacterium 43-6]
MKLRYLLILFGILVPVAIVARVFQLTGTDPTTGFFKAEAVAANNAIMTGFLGVSLLLVVLGRISKSYPKRIHSPSVPMAAASFVMSAGVFTYFGVTLFTLTSITPMDMLYAFLTVGSAVYFIWQGLAYLGYLHFSTILTAFPVLAAALRLGITFVRFNGISSIAENLIDVIMMSVVLLFWLFHGRMFSDIGFRKSAKWVYGTGLAASLISLAGMGPRFFVYFFYGSNKLHETTIPYFIDVLTAVYIVIFLASTYQSLKSKRIADENEGLLIL